MSIEALLVVCADAAVVDRTTNRLSLFNLVEELQAQSFPLLVPQLAIVSLLHRTADEPERAACVIRLDLDEARLFEFPFEADFSGFLFCRATNNLSRLAVPRPGNLRVCLLHGDSELGRWGIRVVGTGSATPVGRQTVSGSDGG